MTFSSKVKAELSRIVPQNDHCMQAQAEARKYFTLVKKKYTIDSYVLERRCCRRAFLREAFLIAGSITDPEKGYHFDIVCQGKDRAEFVRDVINTFDDMDAKVVQRRGKYIVYLKGSDMIVDMLGIMEAPLCYMELENIRILKEMRNSVNRRVNCETANIGKTVSASQKQTEDITLISDTVGLKQLPDVLREMAEVRLKHPDDTLSELGKYFDPPLGKSGVNHRLRKLSELAQKLRTSN